MIYDQDKEKPNVISVDMAGLSSNSTFDDMDTNNYKELNRISWNQRTEVHVASEFYDNESFIAGRNSLNDIEIELLGDVKGKSILHLQCHFGQDTISLNRLGARTVGSDISDTSMEQARELAKVTGSDAEFICCDLYDLPQHLNEQFDIVFTSYGTVCWLPDLDKWASVINRFLKPGGQFIFVDYHPVIFMFDTSFSEMQFRYFNSGPITDEGTGTYTDGDEGVSLNDVSWNHAMSEVIGSLLKQGLQLKDLQEYDYSPYNCFDELMEVEPGKYRIMHMDDILPMVYSIVVQK